MLLIVSLLPFTATSHAGDVNDANSEEKLTNAVPLQMDSAARVWRLSRRVIIFFSPP